jgi:hypothetical protein
MQMPPGSAASSLAAILTPSPNTSSGSTITSPRLNPNSEADARVLRDIGIAVNHRALDLDGTAHGIHHAWKLRQHAAGVLDDAAAVLLDLGVNQLVEMRFDPFVRAFLIGGHQPAVTRDVRGENGGQPAFDASRGQSGARRW